MVESDNSKLLLKIYSGKGKVWELSVFLILFLSVFSGCGRAYYLHSDIDWIGTTQGAGNILVECNGPELPTEIIGYWVSVDDKDPIYVEKFSRQQITLTTGRHQMTIVTIASKEPYLHQPGQQPVSGKYYEYGKKSEASFYLIESGALVARYYPPSNSQEEGKLLVL